jgi:hypothetical protein
MNNHEKLISNLAVYFDAKLSDTHTTEETQFFTQLVDLQRSIKNGNTEIRTISTWWVFWRSKNSTMDSVTGFDERDAMIRLGYGNGAVKAVDFISEAPTNWSVFLPFTLPDHDHESDVETMIEWYNEQTREIVVRYIQENLPTELVRMLKRMDSQQHRAKFLYHDRAFTKRFMDMSKGYMAVINKFLEEVHPEIFAAIDLEADE